MPTGMVCSVLLGAVMGRSLCSRSIATGFSFVLAALAVSAFSQLANATWFDSATGKPVHVTPRDINGPHNEANADHAVFGGHDVYWDKQCSTWRDSGTGNEVHVTPRDINGPHNEANADHAVFGGHDVYWVPCPPPQTASSTVGSPTYSVGVEFGGGSGRFSFEDLNYGTSGAIGGVNFSARFYNQNTFIGAQATVLATGIKGSTFDVGTQVSGTLRMLVPIDGQVGVTFTPSNFLPVTIYGFAGPAFGLQNVTYGAISGTEWMSGVSGGAAVGIQLTPNWSLEAKFRSYSLNKDFNLFPGVTSPSGQHGTIATLGVSYEIGRPDYLRLGQRF